MPKGSVKIDKKRCKTCGICVAVCPTDNLEIQNGHVAIFDRCTGCGLCELHCPDFAIVATRETEPAKKPAVEPAAKKTTKKKRASKASAKEGGKE